MTTIHTYLIEISSDFLTQPLYKIGRSVNIFNRLNQLSQGNIFEYRILNQLKFDAELYLHKLFDRNRVDKNREWFAFTFDELLNVHFQFSTLRRVNKAPQPNTKDAYIN
ncbi:GIY-YIG nuclease family protein [Myxosarcina sp. GI1]|uniref:GIY-YIG nuclease family protein n=1 Tax=Myxosarcina sp. GI1 TaxID=1541065 RepID=UPI000560A659|nr:GIY-YIG nuclease family protein [Myxosarcina sp. GI1]